MTDNQQIFSDDELRQVLDTAAERINSVDFIESDPVQFPRRFDDTRDIEIVSLLAATIAWGNRTMICRDCERLLQLMEYRPYDYVMDGGYEELDGSMNIHRTFFVRNLQHYLRGLRAVYDRYGTLEAFAVAVGATVAEAPAWELVRALGGVMAEANGTASCDNRCLPGNLDTTALKRINMALRWLVRRDGIVDMGIWESMTPAQLFIPLDVHVGNTSRQLGLLTRRSNDRRAVVELTSRLCRYRPDDPVLYDYALFGLGIEHGVK